MSLTARDIMTSDVYTLSPTTSVIDMDAELLSRGISGAPVVSNGKLVGVVSRSDIARKLSDEIEDDNLWSSEPAGLMELMIGHNKNVKPAAEHLRELVVQDIMNNKAISVDPDETVAQVAKLMVEQKIHRVLVKQGEELQGIISSLDVVGIVAA
jgi:CBS domain-containing protein